MLIVTGLGRCGTSAIMKFLIAMGMKDGETSFHGEVRAGYEFAQAWTINRDLYTEQYVKNNQVIGHFKEKIQALKVEVVKDPRFTWHPDLIKIWAETIPIKVLVCHRDPEEVIRSRRLAEQAAQYDFSDPKRKADLSQFQIDFCDFITSLLKNKIQFELIYFPHFVEDFDGTYQALKRLGCEFDYEEAKKKWAETIDPKLVMIK